MKLIKKGKKEKTNRKEGVRPAQRLPRPNSVAAQQRGRGPDQPASLL
jgi:hypothetical protein